MDIDEVVDLVSKKLDVAIEDAEKIIDKAVIGGEALKDGDFSEWYNERFLPNCMFIDETGYSRMCVDALKILSRTAATDYGSSRQRDLGQLWADMTRGYLGEYAFLLFLKERWGITAKLGHEIGQLQFKDPRLSSSHKVLENLIQGGMMMAPMLGQLGALAMLGLVAVNAMTSGQEVPGENRVFIADENAMNYMVDAGYDPQGMIDLMVRFAEADDATTAYFYDYYQARPPTEERMANINEIFSQLPLHNRVLKTFSIF